MIVNRTYRVDRADAELAGGPLAAVEARFEAEPLRWFVAAATDTHFDVEATEYVGEVAPPPPTADPRPASGRDVVVSVVPTGVGCEVGGYAGDAAPATSLLAACADTVVTNPNAVNASNFIHLGDRVAYTEGYGIDLLCSGRANLLVPRANRIGVIVEWADPDAVTEVLNVINVARSVYGVDIVDHVVTDTPIGTRCVRNASGAYVGQLDHPEVLLAAAEKLLAAGATALAITSNVRGLDPATYTDHFAGAHPNPVGGAEAVVSHLVGRFFGVPAAHAPMVNFKHVSVPGGVVDARAAGEFVSASGLACVLIGLRRAPHLTPTTGVRVADVISPADIAAVVAPASALGGVPVLRAHRAGIPVIAVRGNGTLLDVTARRLGLSGVIEVRDYVEAAGTLLALREGISLDSLRRPLRAVGRYEREVAREFA